MISRTRSGLKFQSGLAFSLVWILLTPPSAHAQQPREILAIADSLFAANRLKASETEYWRFTYFAQDDPLVYYALHRAGLVASADGRPFDASDLLRRAIRTAPPGQALIRYKLRYHLAVTLLLSQQYDVARIELFKMTRTNPSPEHESAALLLTGVALAAQGQYNDLAETAARLDSLAAGNPGVKAQLEQIAKSANAIHLNPTIKSARTAKWMSTFIPGTGQIYAGETMTGLAAMAINGATTWLVVRHALNERWVNAVVTATSLWWRYYSGNRNTAAAGAERANANHLTNAQQEILRSIEQVSRVMAGPDLELSLQEATRALSEPF